MTVRFVSPFSLALESIYNFWVLEFENAVIFEFGRTSAKYNAPEPQPHLKTHQRLFV
jgi:hypothetical protein